MKNSYSYADALDYATPEMLINLFAIEINDHNRKTVADFFRRNFQVPNGVKNAVILFVLKILDQRIPFKESYFRKTMESFIANGIKSTSAALSFFYDYMENKEKKARELRDFNTISAPDLDPETEAALKAFYDRIQ